MIKLEKAETWVSVAVALGTGAKYIIKAIKEAKKRK